MTLERCPLCPRSLPTLPALMIHMLGDHGRDVAALVGPVHGPTVAISSPRTQPLPWAAMPGYDPDPYAADYCGPAVTVTAAASAQAVSSR